MRVRAGATAWFIAMGLAGAGAHAADFAGGKAYFATPIAAGAASDANSPAWVTGLGKAPYLNGPGNQYAPPIYEVGPTTPIRTVHCRYCGSETVTTGKGVPDTIQVPIPDGATPDTTPDGEIGFVDHASGREYDLSGAVRNADGSWNAVGAGGFDLRGDGHQDAALGYSAASPSRLPLSQAVSLAEVQTAIGDGSYLIPHALQIGAPNVNGNCWVYPALGGDTMTSGGLPEGARVQLDPAFDTTTLRSPGARVIAHTLQVYGAYLRNVAQAFVVYLRPQTDWTGVDLDGSSLATVAPSQFRVLAADFTTAGTTQPFTRRPDPSCGFGATNVAPQMPAVAPGHTAAIKAPLRFRATVRTFGKSKRVQFVWAGVSGAKSYRVYVDGRLKANVRTAFTKYLPIGKGFHHAYVVAIDKAGKRSPKSKSSAFHG